MDFDFASDTLSLDSGTVLTIDSTGALTLPSGSASTQRPTGVNGMIRYASDTNVLEGFVNSAWATIYTVASQARNTVFAGPASGGNATPSFRTISMIQNDLSDVVLSSPTTGNLLTYNGAQWVNSNTAGSAFTAVVTPNTFVSGNKYSATITHNLGTNNICVSMYDTATNSYVLPDTFVQTSTNVLTVTVIGNTRTYRVVIIANGASIQAGGSTPSSIVVQNNGVNLSGGPFTVVNLAPGLTATNTGAGTATVTPANTIIKLFTYYAASLENPNSSDWAVNSLAPVVADPTYPSFLVRQFSTSVEQGVGSFITVPSNATNITFNWKGRAQTTQFTASAIQPRIYVRSIPNNAPVGVWSSVYNLNVQTVPTNTYFQYFSQGPSTLATYGMVAGGLYLIELTLSTSPTSGIPLFGNWLMSEFTISFT